MHRFQKLLESQKTKKISNIFSFLSLEQHSVSTPYHIRRGTPTKRPVTKCPVTKRPFTKRPVTECYKMSRLTNAHFT